MLRAFKFFVLKEVIKIGVTNIFKKKKKVEDLPDLKDPFIDPVTPNQDLFRQPPMQPQPLEANPFSSHNTEYQTQLILSKLELINNRLAAIEAKISNIEKIAVESQSEQAVPKWKKGSF